MDFVIGRKWGRAAGEWVLVKIGLATGRSMGNNAALVVVKMWVSATGR